MNGLMRLGVLVAAAVGGYLLWRRHVSPAWDFSASLDSPSAVTAPQNQEWKERLLKEFEDRGDTLAILEARLPGFTNALERANSVDEFQVWFLELQRRLRTQSSSGGGTKE